MGDGSDPKSLSRDQFGANAARYATSTVHAEGASLARLLELIDPDPESVALDIATAAGHTALKLAPATGLMVASDLTWEMVELTRRRSIELDNPVTPIQADAERLPFSGDAFDIVTCRIAPHHFPNPEAFVSEVARVLRPGGVFGLVDNIVPSDPEAARWYNDWERRRDPSHVRCLGLDEWQTMLAGAGLQVTHSEVAAKQMRFVPWAERMAVGAEDQASLWADLMGAPALVAEFLGPRGSTPDDTTFDLTEALVIAHQRQ